MQKIDLLGSGWHYNSPFKLIKLVGYISKTSISLGEA